MSLSNVPGEIVHRDILFTVRAVSLFTQVNALHVIIQQLLCLKFLLTVRALIVANFLMEILK